MARAAGSNTKFASVNLNKSYGKPASAAGASSSGGNNNGGAGAGRLLARSSSSSPSHGGMLLLSRPGAAVPSKGGKVIVPRPVNLPSLRREHAGNDPSIALVGGSGSGGWTKAAPVQQQEEVPVVAVSASETTATTTAGMFVCLCRHSWIFVVNQSRVACSLLSRLFLLIEISAFGSVRGLSGYEV